MYDPRPPAIESVTRGFLVSFYNHQGMRIGKPRTVSTLDPHKVDPPGNAAYFSFTSVYTVTLCDDGEHIVLGPERRQLGKRYYLSGEVITPQLAHTVKDAHAQQLWEQNPEVSLVRVAADLYLPLCDDDVFLERP